MAFKVNEFRSHFTGLGEFAKSDKFEVAISVPNSLLTDPRYGMNMQKELTFQCEAAELPGKNVNMIEYRHYAFINRIPHFQTFPEITLTFYCSGVMKEKKFFDAWLDSMIPTSSGLVQYYANDSGINNYSTDIVIKQFSNIGVDLPAENVEDPNAIEEVMVTATPIKNNTLGRRLLDSAVNRAVNTAVDKYIGPVAQFGQYLGDAKTKAQPSTNSTAETVYDCKLIEAMPISVSSLPLNWSDDSIHRLQVTFAYKKWISRAAGVTDTYTNQSTSNFTNEEETKDQRLKGVLEETVFNAANKFISKKLRF